jgi:hypothetical protein
MPGPEVRTLGNLVVVPHLPRVAAAALVAVTLLGSCDKGSREDRFCRKLTEEQQLLAVVPQNPGDLDDFVSRYRELDRITPLAVEEQWHTITELVVAVAEADLQDATAADRLRDQAVAATRSVDQVRAYAQATCGVDLLLAGVGATPTTAPAGAGAPPASAAPPNAPGTVPPTVP